MKITSLCYLAVFLLVAVVSQFEGAIVPDDNAQVSEGHVAFLGEEDNEKYDLLSEDESIERLSQLVKTKVDLDGDDNVSEDELKQWILHIAQLSKEKEMNRTFKMYTNSDFLDYEDYFNRTHGPFIGDHVENVSKENLELLKVQELRKWKMADENGDNKLDRQEFIVFLHPEHYPKMKPVVVQNVLDMCDKNMDGFLDVEEYISYIWSPLRGHQQPDQSIILSEHDTFQSHRDINKDGKLSEDEIAEWLMPSDYDASRAEMMYLMSHSDTNKDRILSLEEIVAAHGIFVGSLATNYGNTLKHEEL